METKKYNWKNLALTVSDSLVKAITIDGLGAVVDGLISNSDGILSEATSSIIIGAPTYFVRGIARDFENQETTKKYLGNYAYMLPYAVGALAGGIKSNLKDEPALKGALRTLSYEIANDYVKDETLFDTMSTILMIEEGTEVFGETSFPDIEDKYKQTFIESAIYSTIIKYVYVPTSTYIRDVLEHKLFPIGISENNIYSGDLS